MKQGGAHIKLTAMWGIDASSSILDADRVQADHKTFNITARRAVQHPYFRRGSKICHELIFVLMDFFRL